MVPLWEAREAAQPENCGEPTPESLGTRSAGDDTQPGTPGVQRLLSLRDACGVTAALRIVQICLEGRDRRLELGSEALRASLAFRVVALPVLLVELAHGSLDLAEPVLDGLDLGARHLADLVPAPLNRDQGLASRVAVGGGQQGLCFRKEGLLAHQVLLELLVVTRVDLRLRGVERVAGGLELRPQRVVVLLAGATGGLP